MKRAGDKIYHSAAWQKLRQAYLSSRNFICERCGQPASIVHHRRYITAGNVDDPFVTLDFANLEALCQNCHNAEHQHFTSQGRALFDSRGDVVAVAGDGDFEAARRAIQLLNFTPPTLASGA